MERYDDSVEIQGHRSSARRIFFLSRKNVRDSLFIRGIPHSRGKDGGQYVQELASRFFNIAKIQQPEKRDHT
jgi:hypothetical protein